MDQSHLEKNDLDIIRDIEAEIDEKFESVTRQGTPNGLSDNNDVQNNTGDSEEKAPHDERTSQMCPKEEIQFRIKIFMTLFKC